VSENDIGKIEVLTEKKALFVIGFIVNTYF